MPIRLALLAVCLLAAGCSGSRSAVSHDAGALAGPWMMTVSPELDLGVGEVRTVLFFEPRDDGFEAHSRPGAVSDLVGGFKGFLAGVLGGEAYARGALLHVYEGELRPVDGGLAVRGRLVAQGLGTVTMQGTLADGSLTGTLNGSQTGQLVARFAAEPFRGELPLADYAAVARAARPVFAQHYFDPRALDGPPWTAFWRTLEGRMGRAQDDFEAMGQFALAAGALDVSHVALQREKPASERADQAAPAAESSGGLTFERLPDGAAALTCTVFEIDQAEPVLDAAFAAMAQDPPRALVVDLRRCIGGDFSSMLVAAHLMRQPEAGGLFLSSEWWASHEATPAQSEWSALPPLADTDLDTFFQRLDEHGALVAEVVPVAPHYDGPVYVLTSGSTASAAEPLAHLLKTTGRATLVGAPTAGAMLASRQFHVDGGWLLRVPVADYYTASGERLEAQGVVPDVEAEVDEALAVALGLSR